MAEAKTIVFGFKELAELLVKNQDIHEGFWGIYIEFGIQGANIQAGPSKEDLLPAAVIPVMKIGIQKFATANQLTVDAAEVNPLPKP